jgi:hypothetical protein
LRIATAYVAPATSEPNDDALGIATTFFPQIAISKPVATHPRTLDLADEALRFADYRSAECRRAGTMYLRLPK